MFGSVLEDDSVNHSKNGGRLASTGEYNGIAVYILVISHHLFLYYQLALKLATVKKQTNKQSTSLGLDNQLLF